MLTKHENNLPTEHKWIWVHTAASVKKKLIHSQHFVLECKQNKKITYRLWTSECTGWHSSRWRNKQKSILKHTSCVSMLIKYECNLLAA